MMEDYFLQPNSVANSQTIPDESVTCIAVKEDKHQNIMSKRISEEGNTRNLGKLVQKIEMGGSTGRNIQEGRDG